MSDPVRTYVLDVFGVTEEELIAFDPSYPDARAAASAEIEQYKAAMDILGRELAAAAQESILAMVRAAGFNPPLADTITVTYDRPTTEG